MSTQSQFTKLLVDIEPSETTKTEASTAQRNLRNYLRNHQVFREYHVETFLSGSYGRNTSIRPRVIDGVVSRPDIDIIVVTAHTLSDEPAKILTLITEILEEEYQVENRKNDRSVSVATSRVKMDVVPIIEAPAGNVHKYYIPDRRLDTWIGTNPPGHGEWATAVNKAADGRFKPLVKLVKWWRRENPTSDKGNRPKGFVIEMMVSECMDFTEENYPELFTGTLESIVSKYGPYESLRLVPQLQDPSVPGNVVTSRLSLEDFTAFMAKAREHAKIARKAMNETDLDKAREHWLEIFGRFPKSGKHAAESLLSSVPVPGALGFPDHAVVPKKPGGFA